MAKNRTRPPWKAVAPMASFEALSAPAHSGMALVPDGLVPLLAACHAILPPGVDPGAVAAGLRKTMALCAAVVAEKASLTQGHESFAEFGLDLLDWADAVARAAETAFQSLRSLGAASGSATDLVREAARLSRCADVLVLSAEEWVSTRPFALRVSPRVCAALSACEHAVASVRESIERRPHLRRLADAADQAALSAFPPRVFDATTGPRTQDVAEHLGAYAAGLCSNHERLAAWVEAASDALPLAAFDEAAA